MLRVRVRPRASPEGLAGAHAGALLVRLGASPVKGAANRALLALMGRVLKVGPSAISIRRGSVGRDKLLCVRGATVEVVRARLQAALGGARP